MKDYSVQNFTFTKGRIFPNDWLQTKPYLTADAVDLYYVSLANRVADIIKGSFVAPAFDSKEGLLKAALVFTCWFEDICSGTGIWKVVNDECEKRYGRLLPFYDMFEYSPGEVNLQDINLLVWDIVQSEHTGEGRVMNPENPGNLELAMKLFKLFYDEYEYAPENERLKGFVMNPLASEHIWEARGLMSWFHYRSYVGHSAQRILLKTLKDEGMPMDIADSSEYSKILYSYSTVLTFTDKCNLLSLTTPQWLSRIRGGDKAFEDVQFAETRLYKYLSFDEKGMKVADLVNDKELIVEKDSFDVNTFNPKVYQKGEMYLSFAGMVFDGKFFMCGSMMGRTIDARVREVLKQQKEHEMLRKIQPAVYEDFMKASGGKPFILMATAEDMNDFFVTKMKKSMKAGIDMPEHIRSHNNFIMSADPEMGIISAPKLAACLAMQGNKLYDKVYANKNALQFFVNPDAVSYKLACTVQDMGLVPDAFLNSIQGEEYGRKFLHANGRFITDYFFNCCRQYDL